MSRTRWSAATQVLRAENPHEKLAELKAVVHLSHDRRGDPIYALCATLRAQEPRWVEYHPFDPAISGLVKECLRALGDRSSTFEWRSGDSHEKKYYFARFQSPTHGHIMVSLSCPTTFEMRITKIYENDEEYRFHQPSSKWQ